MVSYQKMENIKEINEIASRLFVDTYTNKLSNEQIAYMLDMFFKEENIITNINEGYKYEYIIKDNTICGFIAYVMHEDYLYLSKLYIMPSYKGQNIAHEVFEYLMKNELPVRLNVCKDNEHAKHVYIKNGFKVIDSLVVDIGSNFYMDDYVMQKDL